MRIFLTGATGVTGSSILDNLLSHGHDVTCTVRTDQKAQEISCKGPSAHPILFDLNPSSASQLSEMCIGYDAIIHTAFNHTADGILTEEIATDAFISAARKTAETKPVSLITTSGGMVNGNTNGPMDEDHDDTSHPLPSVAKRIIFEKKIINATAGNLYGAVLRPVWIYGDSYVHNYIVACKNSSKIVAIKANNTNCFVHREDLAEMFRIIMENRACGLFLASEPEPVYIDSLVEKLANAIGVQNIERVEDFSSHMSTYGFYLFGQTFSQIFVPKRLKDLYGYTAQHRFLDWLETQHF